jgi:hypothetical protein
MSHRYLAVPLLLTLPCQPLLASDYFLRIGLASNQSDTFTSSFGAGGNTALVRDTVFEDATQMAVAISRPFGSWRTELELFHQLEAGIERNGEAQTASSGGGAFDVKLTGDVSATGVMLSGYLDFASEAEARIRPYASFSAGAAQLQMRRVVLSASGDVVGMRSATVTDLAWRAGLGVAWQLQGGAYVDLGVSRYDYGTAESSKSGFSTGLDGPVSLDQPFDFDVRGLSWSLSLRRPL